MTWKRNTIRPAWTWAIAAACVAAIAVGGLMNGYPAKADANAVATAKAMSDAFATVAERVSPAVVFIRVERSMPTMHGRMRGPQGQAPMTPQDFFEQFFGRGFGGPAPEAPGHPGMPGPRVPVGQGSGFIISPDGYIVTNHHVAGEADGLKVTLQDGREFDAELVGSDPLTEVALVKVEAQGLPYVEFGDSDALRVGEWVLAIGSPFGLSHTVTSGIVSASGRGNIGIGAPDFYADFIQTDAAINPGNSGGPLLDLDGKVVGMNTAIVSRSGGNNGIGFAIPVNMVAFVVDQLKDTGSVTRGFLGIMIQDLTPELGEWFGVDRGQGVIVADVNPGTPAESAGLQRDDVIVGLDGKPVTDAATFRSRVSTTPAGSGVTLDILRDGKALTKTVNLGSLEPEAVASAPQRPAQEQGIGIEIQALTDDVAQRLGYEGERGVVVSDVMPGSPAAMAGIRPGALIKEVNRQTVQNPSDFRAALESGRDRGKVLLLVKEQGGSRYVALDLR